MVYLFLERELFVERFLMIISEGSLGVFVLNGVEIDELWLLIYLRGNNDWLL